MAKKKQSPLEKVRAIIAGFPDTSEKLSHGAPTFWGGRKTFATYHDGHYDDGQEAVWIKAPEGAQEMLVASNPQRFYRPKYLGPAGWVGVRLNGESDWEELRFLLEQGYRLVAPKRAIAKLDAKG
ncbi:MAG: MmcQ/YjbR family DNA-binding protein [Polyangiaceae bacterium]